MQHGGPLEFSRREIRNRIQKWTRTDIAWDGLGLGSFDQPDNEPWIRPIIATVSTTQDTYRGGGSNSLTRHEGFIEVQFFFPQGWLGGVDPYRYLDEFSALFRHQTDDSERLTYLEPHPLHVGNDLTAKWYQQNLRVPFIHLIHPVDSAQNGVDLMIVTQASNTFSVAEAIRADGETWTHAFATSTGTLASGIVAAKSGDQFSVVGSGYIENIAHGLGTSGEIYLSTATSGAITTTLPTAIQQSLGNVVDSNTLFVNIQFISTGA